MLSQSVKSEINKLWNKFWSGGISNPLTAIEQISYLLFMRRLDELDLREMKKAEFSGENIHPCFRDFQIPNSNERIDNQNSAGAISSRWKVGKCYRMFRLNIPFIKQLNGEGTTFGKHMRDAVFIIPKLLFLLRQ